MPVRFSQFLTIVFGLIALWGCFLTALVMLSNMMTSAQEFDEPLEWAWFALLMAVAVVGLVIGGWSLVQNVPDERIQVAHASDESLRPITRGFRVRSGLYRIGAAALFAILAMVTVIGFWVVSTPARDRATYYETLPGRLDDIIEPLTGTEFGTGMLGDPDAVKLLTAILQHGSYPTWGETIGALTLLIFLVQIVGSLFRYMVRLASFYDSRADYLQLGGKVRDLKPDELLAIVEARLPSDGGTIREALHIWAKARRRT